jgi:glycosyltransferase involved in cell wall biosynthesis
LIDAKKEGGDVADSGSTVSGDGSQSPLVTVAIPTYRRPDLLRVAIDSVLSQTYSNMEILVSDSDSSDEIAALVAGYGDPRLRYRRNARRTNGLQNALAMYRDARGELIATLHDDDEWEPGFLTAMVRPLVEDPTVVLTFADHWVMDAEGNVLVAKTEWFTRECGRAGLAAGRKQPFTRLALVDRAVFFVVAAVFRNGLLDWDEVPPEVAPPYELWMAYLASRDGSAAYYVPERNMRYRVHGLAEHETRFERPAVWIYDHILLDERLADLRDDILRASAPFRASLGISLLAEGDAVQARRHLLQGLRAGAWFHASAGLAISLLPPSIRPHAIERLRAIARRRRNRGFYARSRAPHGEHRSVARTQV